MNSTAKEIRNAITDKISRYFAVTPAEATAATDLPLKTRPSATNPAIAKRSTICVWSSFSVRR